MNINFSTSTNNNKSSFGQWKRVTITGFDNIINRAYSLRNIMEANPRSQACFYSASEGKFNVTKSIFALIEYISAPTVARENGGKVVDVYVNGRFPRKLFNALKQCLMAPDADSAAEISNNAVRNFRAKV